MVCNIFFPFHRLTFYAIDSFFGFADAFSSEVFTFISFAFVDCALVSYPCVHCQDQFHEVFLLCFPIRALSFEGVFQSLCHFKLSILILYQFPVSFFTCGYKVFLTPFVEETVFSLLRTLGTLVEDPLTIYVVYLPPGFYSVPLLCMSLLMTVPCTHTHTHMCWQEYQEIETLVPC